MLYNLYTTLLLNGYQITHKLQLLVGIYKQSINRVNPDQLASKKPADLDLHCFRNTNSFSMIRINM